MLYYYAIYLKKKQNRFFFSKKKEKSVEKSIFFFFFQKEKKKNCGHPSPKHVFLYFRSRRAHLDPQNMFFCIYNGNRWDILNLRKKYFFFFLHFGEGGELLGGRIICMFKLYIYINV